MNTYHVTYTVGDTKLYHQAFKRTGYKGHHWTHHKSKAGKYTAQDIKTIPGLIYPCHVFEPVVQDVPLLPAGDTIKLIPAHCIDSSQAPNHYPQRIDRSAA